MKSVQHYGKKICERIINKETNECKVDSQEVEKYLFDWNEANAFKGIINHLTEISGGNVHDKSIVSISSSSTQSKYYPQHAADFNNKSCSNRLFTKNETNS